MPDSATIELLRGAVQLAKRPVEVACELVEGLLGQPVSGACQRF